MTAPAPSPEPQENQPVTDEEARDISIAVQVFWMIVCIVIAVGVWGCAVDGMSWLFDTGCPYLIGAGIVLAFNGSHFAWGWFRPDEDLTDLAPDKGPLMLTNWEKDRALIRIISLLTVSPSMYLQHIVALLRLKNSED